MEAKYENEIFNEIKENIDRFEAAIDYKFNNREYILEALTHSSYSNENKNSNTMKEWNF